MAKQRKRRGGPARRRGGAMSGMRRGFRSMVRGGGRRRAAPHRQFYRVMAILFGVAIVLFLLWAARQF